ncbi:MAG TPA: hypothetical protein VK466_16935 [Terriglobales bacterium]|nr:hypothetical protein [Terriglobales bacterium]
MARKSKARGKPVEQEFIDDPLGLPQGLGPDSAGQSGDLQGLSDLADADSESVEQLIAEGQALEAGVVEGVEEGEESETTPEVRVHERSEDDVPPEYLDRE